METFESRDYRAVLRHRISGIRKLRPAMTMKALAARVPIQYTYLSRALRNDTIHLGEDDLFTLCALLELSAPETEYLVLLRAHAVAKSAARREHLENRLQAMRRKRDLEAKPQEFKSDRLAIEAAYLFDPTAILVHVSLFVPEYAENPRRLCAVFGISPGRLQKVLASLAAVGFAEPAEGGAWRALKGSLHYSPDHPLMRPHQALSKSALAVRMAQTDEDSKMSFLTTFATDEETFRAIGDRFRAFLRDIETLSRRSKPRGTYQMAFDLLRWT